MAATRNAARRKSREPEPEQKNRPVMRAYSVPQGDGPWKEIGAVWGTKRDGYYRLPLDAMPLDGVIMLIRDDVDPRFNTEEEA
jgi:hypothetical protein